MLAIGGMALMLVFGIGARATETGFRLGRTALSEADGAVAIDTYRAVIEGLAISPADIPPETFGMSVIEVSPTRVTGDVVLARDTVCGLAGPVRDLRLEIRLVGDGAEVVCSHAGSDPTVLLRAERPLYFSASEDGAAWTPDWTNALDAPVFDEDSLTLGRDRRLFVRLSDETGGVEIVAFARSGRASLYFLRQGELF